jgi:hypothetical protein
MSATLNNNDDEGWRRRLQLFGVEGLNDIDRWRMRQAERSEQRALVRAEQQRTQQHSGATSEEVARARDEITGLRTELDGLRSDVVTGLKAVGDGFDYITDSESEHTAEREEQVRSLQSEVSALRNELAAARAEGMERTAKATIAVFTEIAAQRAAVDQLMEKEREKNAQTLLLAAGRDEQLRVLQDEVSALRAQMAAVRVEGAERLATAAKATLEAFNEAAAQRAAVARLIDANRVEMDSLNSRTVSLMADMKALKDASENFKFAREKDDGPLDVPAFLPTPERSVN